MLYFYSNPCNLLYFYLIKSCFKIFLMIRSDIEFVSWTAASFELYILEEFLSDNNLNLCFSYICVCVCKYKDREGVVSTTTEARWKMWNGKTVKTISTIAHTFKSQIKLLFITAVFVYLILLLYLPFFRKFCV